MFKTTQKYTNNRDIHGIICRDPFIKLQVSKTFDEFGNILFAIFTEINQYHRNYFQIDNKSWHIFQQKRKICQLSRVSIQHVKWFSLLHLIDVINGCYRRVRQICTHTHTQQHQKFTNLKLSKRINILCLEIYVGQCKMTAHFIALMNDFWFANRNIWSRSLCVAFVELRSTLSHLIVLHIIFYCHIWCDEK